MTVNYAMSDKITSHLLGASIDKAMLDPYVAHTGVSDTRFMTHLHGAFVDGPNDGNPFATEHTAEWGPGQTESKVYPAQDRAALIWYHQHAHGITHLNVYAGLAGGYLLRDADDTGLSDNRFGLPANVECRRGPDRALRGAAGHPGPDVRAQRRRHWARSVLPAGAVGARVLRGHDVRQRGGRAVPADRAAALPVPHHQRLQRAVPQPRTSPGERSPARGRRCT